MPYGWACPLCRSKILVSADELVCSGCAAAYPCIHGVPILVEAPARFLMATLQRVQGTSKAARERLRLVESISNSEILDESLARLRQVGAAQVANSLVFEELVRPVEGWLSHLPPAVTPTNDAAEESAPDLGWDATALIPFLIRDWKCNRELNAAFKIISSALHGHLDETKYGTLAMLGCGAGGLLGRLSPRFSQAIGLELSVPALMAVRSLQNGDRLCLRYPTSSAGARMGEIAIDAAPTALHNVSLAVADACSTPFETGSIDCVITSFLLDVVDDPPAVAREIHRILGPSGLWINYGPSSSMAAVWRFDEEESSAFIKAMGFSVLATARHRTTHLDLRQVDESTHYHSHICYLSVARKQ